jgi:putative Mn2+ efflux pump MntP
MALLATAFALALDAFAVATVAGIRLDALTRRRVFRLSFHFGLFQAGMLALGWLLGSAVQRLLASFAQWVAFVLLAAVGANIIWQAARRGADDAAPPDPTRGWELVFASVATSLDAAAVGVSLAMIGTHIGVPALLVGLMAAVMTLLGMAMGRRLGGLWGRRLEFVGGVVLIVIGAGVLWPH